MTDLSRSAKIRLARDWREWHLETVEHKQTVVKAIDDRGNELLVVKELA